MNKKEIKKLKIQKIKNMVLEILSNEFGNDGINVNIIPATNLDYYRDYVFKKKKRNILDFIEPLYSLGLYDENNNVIIIFLNKLEKIEKEEKMILDLLYYCYHELRHAMQNKVDIWSYQAFLESIEEIIRITCSVDYLLEHDNYSYEIGANIYGITRTKEYLKEKLPSFYDAVFDEIEKREQQIYINYMLYDASDVFDIAMNEVIKKIEQENIFYFIPIFDIFLKDDGSFKRISEMIKDERFNNLDERIVAAILSSKTFLKKTNIGGLSLKELIVLRYALNYTNQIYCNQEKFIELIRNNGVNSLERKMIKEEILNPIRDINKKKEHIQSIPIYLKNINKLIRIKK